MKKLALFVLLTMLVLTALFSSKEALADATITISPDLDVSLFTPYKIYKTFADSPNSVDLKIAGINGDNPSSTCWDYTIDGTCASTEKNMSMTYDALNSRWQSPNVYPDYIYPEVYFAPSEITWNNQPLNIPIWRRSYHVMKFNNPFTMTDGMSFWIEFNAAPVNTNNSGDLMIYLVGNVDPATYYSSDWRNKAQTELMATFSKDDTYHHNHTPGTDYSTHFLVPLSTNSDGTIGTKNINISSGFSVVIYQDSPNVNRGWNLRYQPSNLCTYSNRWLVGDRSGGGTWNTPVSNSGCPDAHIHVARRLTDINTLIQDGVRITTTANYDGLPSVVATRDVFFEPLPNLAPSPTSFVTPVANGIYDGDSINVSWNQATDPNNDNLLYSVMLLDSEGNEVSTLLSLSDQTSFSWDITEVVNGTYSLKGVITEDVLEDPLSTTFYLGGNFTINKAIPIYSLSSIQISSDNDLNMWAKSGDNIMISFTATGNIEPSITVYSGGQLVTNPVVINPSGLSTSFSAYFDVSENDTDGTISFDISASNLDMVYEITTDDSYVEVDKTAPLDVVADPTPDSFDEPFSLSLSSVGSDFIRYTTDESSPSCSSGSLYSTAINISQPVIIKAIACDLAGNVSSIATFEYGFEYVLSYSAQTGGSISGQSSQTISYGQDGSAVEALPDTGYHFVKWSDDVTQNPRTDTNVADSLAIEAIFAVNKYNFIDVPTGVILVLPDEYDFEDGLTHGASFILEIKNESGILIARKTVTMLDDVDMSEVLIGSDQNQGRSFIHGLVGEFTLFIPKKAGDNKVAICPGATSLSGLSQNCSGIYFLDSDDDNVQIVSIGGVDYWQISGLVGTGGFSFVQNENESENLAQTGSSIWLVWSIGIIVLLLVTDFVKHANINRETKRRGFNKNA